MSATIKDVAKLANVSAMTVSRTVNRHGSVAPDTRERVFKAIETLQYKPNTIARTLVAQKSKIISLIVPDIANPFFSELIKTAECLVKKNGYNLIIGDAGWDIQYERDFINASIGRMSDGVIMFTPRLDESELVKFSKSVRLVVVDRKIDDPSVNYVYVDNYRGAFQATEHLIKLGHRRIGFIRGWEDVLNTKRREKGYRDALRRYRMPFDPALVQIGDYQSQSGYNSFRYFANLARRPTAVFASNDLMAYGFISACHQAGLRVPDDISVMGFDDISIFPGFHPALSTVTNPRIPMIRAAIHLLLGTESGEEEKALKDQLKTTLVIRESVKENSHTDGGGIDV